MNYRFLILSFIILALCSCTGGEDNVKIPSDIVPPDSMVGLLVDFHLVEAAAQIQQQQGKDPANYTSYYYSSVMKKHNLTRADIARCMEFYSYHPKLLREIYDDVITELSTLQSKHMPHGSRPRKSKE